jgi:alpha-L-rhamnosidase
MRKTYTAGPQRKQCDIVRRTFKKRGPTKTARGVWLAFAAILLCLVAATHTLTQSTDPLVTGFKNPPDSARPRGWWHWTQGNVTREGITKDLEWMKRAGIAGFQLADVASRSGPEVSNKINFGTPEWFDAVKHAASEAKRLGLEMTIFSSPGWSETGGPWVTPQQGWLKRAAEQWTRSGPGDYFSQ